MRRWCLPPMIVEPTPVQPGDQSPPPRPGRRRSDREIVLFALGLLAVAAILVLLPDLTPSAAKGLVSERIHARIVEVPPPTDQNVPTAIVQFVEGERRGEKETANLEGPSGQLQLPDYAVGDEVVVAVDNPPDGTPTFSVVDRWRLPLIAGLALAFALVTIAVAGWRGVRSIVALALSLVLAIRVLIPLLLAGWNPLALAIGLGALVTVLSFVLTQGWTRTTASAITGTLAGLFITGVLAAVVTTLARFTPGPGIAGGPRDRPARRRHDRPLGPAPRRGRVRRTRRAQRRRYQPGGDRRGAPLGRSVARPGGPLRANDERRHRPSGATVNTLVFAYLGSGAAAARPVLDPGPRPGLPAQRGGHRGRGGPDPDRQHRDRPDRPRSPTALAVRMLDDRRTFSAVRGRRSTTSSSP